MLDNCNCPLGEIPDIPDFDCDVDLGQIQKFAIFKSGYKFNPAGGTNDITLGATWTGLLLATDSTKVQISPFFEQGAITAGEPITTGGGDNTTLNGVEKITGTNPSQFNGMFSSIPQTLAEAMQELQCFKDLEVIFFNEEDKIIAKNTTGAGDVTDEITGFPIQSFHIADLNNEGFGTSDHNAVRFALKKRWSNGLEKYTPNDFSPLSLSNTGS
jgi:hypothetical protein